VEDDKKSTGPPGRAHGPRKWGSVGKRASIGLEKQIEMRVMPDRIVIGRKDVVVPVGNGETPDEMIGRVVTGIDRTAEKWGEPPSSFYWQPKVKFIVYPGGNQYYERLRGPLESKWGVHTTIEYPADEETARPAGGRK